jgi:OHCU decarboxylase
VTLGELNALSREDATRELMRCCGSTRWAAAMVALRPFESIDRLQAAAEDVWWQLEKSDWLEAFSHHPRIGERAAGWAAGEQSGISAASDDVARRLRELNHTYERKFDHVFLICATGRSAGEMLANLESRMNNEPAREIEIAAQEQAKITRIRIDKLLTGTTQDANSR